MLERSMDVGGAVPPTEPGGGASSPPLQAARSDAKRLAAARKLRNMELLSSGYATAGAGPGLHLTPCRPAPGGRAMFLTPSLRAPWGDREAHRLAAPWSRCYDCAKGRPQPLCPEDGPRLLPSRHTLHSPWTTITPWTWTRSSRPSARRTSSPSASSPSTVDSSSPPAT